MSTKNKTKLVGEITYQKAVQELEKILSDMQGDQVDFDKLIVQLKRAYELIAFCKDKIKQTEMKITEINDKFND